MKQPYTLGLDIGIASVGWCLLGENRIIDLGVRAFDKAETAKEGEPLNLTRRMARLARHRLAQRAWRLKKLARELKRHGLINSPRFFQQSPALVSPWQLRVAGLERKLDAEEWARVIYHLCKHRGFHWISRAESPMACAPVEQAVTTAWFGPLKPNRMLTCPLTRLISEPGMKNGLTRFGPFSLIARPSRQSSANRRSPIRSSHRCAGGFPRPRASSLHRAPPSWPPPRHRG